MPSPTSAQLIGEEGCPVSGPPTDQTGNTLQQFANDTNQGVVYDDNKAVLQLQRQGGVFNPTTFGVSDTFVAAATADFDEDGWTDFVGARESDLFLAFYKNRTYENPAPNWDDPSAIRTPKFVRTNTIMTGLGFGRVSMATGDFDNDGHQDFIYFKNLSPDDSYMNYFRLYRGNGDGTFKSPYNMMNNYQDLGYMAWLYKNVTAGDYNGDGWLDFIWGAKTSSSSSSGMVRAFINNCPDVWAPGKKCSIAPKFSRVTLLSGQYFGWSGIGAVAWTDVTNDGRDDLIIGAPSLCYSNSSKPLRLYPGKASGGINTSYQTIPSIGASTLNLVADFSLDGKTDLIYGTDHWRCGSHIGGQSYYYQNDGDSVPFSGGVTQQLTYHQSHLAGNLYDFDLGAVLDYDKDPDGTMDYIIADGNHSGTFFVFANRVIATYVQCGDVISGILDLGSLASEEMVINSVRLDPDMDLPPGTSVTFYVSNQEPANWTLANACADNPSEYCASFPSPVGREIRWKAHMCSDSYRTKTPTIGGIEITYDYSAAELHYRAGVVVHDGVAYVGAFRQPGARGHLFATNAGLTTTYWDAATNIDAVSDANRNIYTASADGSTLVDFTVANANDGTLQATLGTVTQAQTENVINWVRGARFGIPNSGKPMSRLGAVETSTPAVVSAPSLPWWYNFAEESERTEIDAFITKYQARQALVLYGSRDGGVHAARTIPTAITDPLNGTEAWSFIPAGVASRFLSDMAGNTATAYPDGSPTVADVKLSDGEYHTVAIMGLGNGGENVVAIDVTETIDLDTNAVVGPKPLWEVSITDAGQSFSKPVIARAKVDGTPTYLAIFGTGPSYSEPPPDPPYSKGTLVFAYDIATGTEKWRFQTKCPLTSDILVFETNDPQEPGSPDYDGYLDRAVFADSCGHVYKVDLSTAAGAGYYQAGMGSVTVPHPDGDITALFSVELSSGALGEQRPIAGTIATAIDVTKRAVIFFGTGGLESFDPTKKNEFYAVYADIGELRTKLEGTCTGGLCEKFYGGVVVTQDQVIVNRSIDPPVATNNCDVGTSVLEGFRIDEAADAFVTDFSRAFGAAIASSLFAHGGAVYAATLSGSIARIGTPRSTDAGGDTAGGYGNETGDIGETTGGGPGGRSPLTLRGWWWTH